MKQDWPKDAQETVENLQGALRSETALMNGLYDLSTTLFNGIAEALDQLNSSESGYGCAGALRKLLDLREPSNDKVTLKKCD